MASIDEDRERRGDRLTPRLARGGGSTWQSLRRGTGSLETDFLNGEIALLARLHGVDGAGERRAADGGQRRGPPHARAAVAAGGRPAQGCWLTDRDDLAGHVRREIAGEEHDDVRDFPRLGRAPERLAGLELGEQFLGRDLGEEGCIASDGATALTRTLCAAASIAAQRVSAMTPAFAAA